MREKEERWNKFKGWRGREGRMKREINNKVGKKEKEKVGKKKEKWWKEREERAGQSTYGGTWKYTWRQ